MWKKKQFEIREQKQTNKVTPSVQLSCPGQLKMHHLIVCYDFFCVWIDCFSLSFGLVHTFIVELMKTLERVFLEKGRHLLFVICYLTVILEYLSGTTSPIVDMANTSHQELHYSSSSFTMVFCVDMIDPEKIYTVVSFSLTHCLPLPAKSFRRYYN